MGGYQNKMICISCGKETENSGSLCLDCRLHSFGIKREGRLELTLCPKCGAIKTNRRWIYSGIGESINRIAAKLFMGKHKKLEFSVTVGDIDRNLKNGIAHSHVRVTQEGADWEYEEEIPYHIQRESCPRCNRSTGSYYEAVVQVRGFSGSGNATIDRFVEGAIKSSQEWVSSISRVSKKPEGTDLFFLKYKNAEHFARRIASAIMSELSVTKKISGRDNGLDLYRYTYLVRIFDIPAGGVVRHNGTDYIVIEVQSKLLTLINTSNGERMKMDPREFYGGRNSVVSTQDLSEAYDVLYRSGNETHVVSQDGMSMLTIPGNYEAGRIRVVRYRNSVFPIPEEKIN